MTLAAPTSARSTQSARAGRELGIVALAMGGYFGLRLVVEGDRATAIRNAERLLRVEDSLGIDVETDLQGWVLAHDAVRWALSAGYVWLHWPMLVAAMAFLALRAPDVLVRLRNAMIVSGAIGIVLFTVLPMAPPRFLPGFVGTVSDDARRHYLPYSLEWTNQVAAFPSYHIGWTLIACLAVAGVVRDRRARWAVLAPAAIVAVAVVGTGNHYVLDSFTGAVFALCAWWFAGWGILAPRSVRHRHHGHGARIAVDAHDRPVADPPGRVDGGHHARAPELSRDDDRVAHLPTHVHHDRLERLEQWGP